MKLGVNVEGEMDGKGDIRRRIGGVDRAMVRGNCWRRG